MAERAPTTMVQAGDEEERNSDFKERVPTLTIPEEAKQGKLGKCPKCPNGQVGVPRNAIEPLELGCLQGASKPDNGGLGVLRNEPK